MAAGPPALARVWTAQLPDASAKGTDRSWSTFEGFLTGLDSRADWLGKLGGAEV
jgi:hypothetical protein